jgi:hypothetical protein
VYAVAPISTPLRGRTAAARYKRGTTFLFRLDQPATITLVVTRTGRCRRPIPGTRRRSRCTRTVATLTRSAHAGLNKLPFSGRIRGTALAPGDYRAAFVAANSIGRSVTRALRFRIVRR